MALQENYTNLSTYTTWQTIGNNYLNIEGRIWIDQGPTKRYLELLMVFYYVISGLSIHSTYGIWPKKTKDHDFLEKLCKIRIDLFIEIDTFLKMLFPTALNDLKWPQKWSFCVCVQLTITLPMVDHALCWRKYFFFFENLF